MSTISKFVELASIQLADPENAIDQYAVGVIKSAGYNEQFAIGTITTSGTLGILIPPSVVFIVYGVNDDHIQPF